MTEHRKVKERQQDSDKNIILPPREDVPADLFKPMPGKIVVQMFERSEWLSEGLIIAPIESQNVPCTTGRVVTVYEPFSYDPGVEPDHEPMVKPGDVIVFGQFAGTAVTYKRRKVLIVTEKDILCIINRPNAEEIAAEVDADA